LIADLADRERKLLQLADHMVQVEENERRRISRELHDEAGQSLACIRLQLELVGMNLPATYKEIREQLNETREITERTILDMRRLISDLSPVVLDQFGLAAAIRQLCKRLEASSGIKMTLKLEPIPEITRKLQMVIYRIVQECCNNVAKHSRASNVNISLRSADEIIELRVADNGVGFDATKVDQKTDSYGLSGIRERVALLGGRFSIVSTPRSVRKKGRYGTEVLVEVPTSSEVIRKNI
jgi:signal transduction histidine kinase